MKLRLGIWQLLALTPIIVNTASLLQVPKAIILDTDIFSDVDDVGALAIANVLHNCGFADLRAVMINTGSKYGALAANAVNTYFDNADIPVGAIRPLTEETFLDRYYYRLGEYASKVAHNFPRTFNDSADTQTPLQLYRSTLASATNNSINVISIGFLTNLADLLRSESDETSSMTGVELVEAKVAELVVMGGRYPSGWEFNFAGVDPDSAAYVSHNWPQSVPVTYAGYELGALIYSGGQLSADAPADSPVLAAYQWYGDRCNTTGKSYDPVTVFYGILGLEGYGELGLDAPFEFANNHGYNDVAPDGVNTWIDDDKVENQHWLRLREGVAPEDIGHMLDRLLACGPPHRTGAEDESCFASRFQTQLLGTSWESAEGARFVDLE